MFQCEVVSIGGTYTNPLSIHTAMTILYLLRLFWSLCPHGHTSFSLNRFSVTDSYWVLISMPSIGIHRSPFIVIHYLSFSIHAACGRCDTISGILFQHWSFLLYMSSWDIHRSPSIVYRYWLVFWVLILGILPLCCFNVSTLPSVSLTP